MAALHIGLDFIIFQQAATIHNRPKRPYLPRERLPCIYAEMSTNVNRDGTRGNTGAAVGCPFFVVCLWCVCVRSLGAWDFPCWPFSPWFVRGSKRNFSCFVRASKQLTAADPIRSRMACRVWFVFASKRDYPSGFVRASMGFSYRQISHQMSSIAPPRTVGDWFLYRRKPQHFSTFCSCERFCRYSLPPFRFTPPRTPKKARRAVLRFDHTRAKQTKQNATQRNHRANSAI